MPRYGKFGLASFFVAVCAASVLPTASTAAAGIAQPRVVSQDPVNYTPNLVGDATVAHPAVYAFEPSATLPQMYVGGQFHSLQNAQRTSSYVRPYIAAFNRTTGAVSTSFHPVLDGSVWAIVSVGSSVYAAGEFTHVNGVARRGLVKLNASGSVDPAFNASSTFSEGVAYDLKSVKGRLIVGGSFPKGLAALSPTSGADTGYLNLGISGSVATLTKEPTHVYRFAVNPGASRLVAIGNFTTVSGQARARAFMLNLGASKGVLASWYYAPLSRYCNHKNVPAYLRDVDFSPTGSYFVLVASGNVPTKGRIGTDVCDAAARLETNIAHQSKPTWINYTGGDTLHSVAVSSKAVYVQGHNRWLDNPTGHGSCLTTCVVRHGIGAIDPVSGRALEWNPVKGRGVGGKETLLTPQGLWVGSDTSLIHREYHYGIALMPL